VTYKTASRMANLIRNTLMSDDQRKLHGYVEVDEALVDGKPRKHMKRSDAARLHDRGREGPVHRGAHGSRRGRRRRVPRRVVSCRTAWGRRTARVSPLDDVAVSNPSPKGRGAALELLAEGCLAKAAPLMGWVRRTYRSLWTTTSPTGRMV
jgi:hypothetical protein